MAAAPGPAPELADPGSGHVQRVRPAGARASSCHVLHGRPAHDNAAASKPHPRYAVPFTPVADPVLGTATGLFTTSTVSPSSPASLAQHIAARAGADASQPLHCAVLPCIVPHCAVLHYIHPCERDAAAAVEQAVPSRRWSDEGAWSGVGGYAGARVKVMRCAAAGPLVPIPGCNRQAFDAGVGFNIDLTGAGVRPVVRPTPTSLSGASHNTSLRRSLGSAGVAVVIHSHYITTQYHDCHKTWVPPSCFAAQAHRPAFLSPPLTTAVVYLRGGLRV